MKLSKRENMKEEDGGELRENEWEKEFNWRGEEGREESNWEKEREESNWRGEKSKKKRYFWKKEENKKERMLPFFTFS